MCLPRPFSLGGAKSHHGSSAILRNKPTTADKHILKRPTKHIRLPRGYLYDITTGDPLILCAPNHIHEDNNKQDQVKKKKCTEAQRHTVTSQRFPHHNSIPTPPRNTPSQTEASFQPNPLVPQEREKETQRKKSPFPQGTHQEDENRYKAVQRWEKKKRGQGKGKHHLISRAYPLFPFSTPPFREHQK